MITRNPQKHRITLDDFRSQKRTIESRKLHHGDCRRPVIGEIHLDDYWAENFARRVEIHLRLGNWSVAKKVIDDARRHAIELATTSILDTSLVDAGLDSTTAGRLESFNLTLVRHIIDLPRSRFAQEKLLRGCYTDRIMRFIEQIKIRIAIEEGADLSAGDDEADEVDDAASQTETETEPKLLRIP